MMELMHLPLRNVLPDCLKNVYLKRNVLSNKVGNNSFLPIRHLHTAESDPGMGGELTPRWQRRRKKC